jgi:hypothetical protein
VGIAEPPAHGTVTIENGTGFTRFAQNNQRFACNRSRSPCGFIVRRRPIVFVTLSDPIGSGSITGLRRPGGNLTGFIPWDPAMVGKWNDLLLLGLIILDFFS